MNTNHNKKCRVLPGLVLLVAQMAFNSIYAADTKDNRGEFSVTDYKFVKAAACGGVLEVNLGNIAAANSHNIGVQKFGLLMVKDHGNAGQNLAQIASLKGASLPDHMTTIQQKEMDRLAQLSGPKFDKAYVAFMVKCHIADEKAFKQASEDAQDADLKTFAATTLTMVRGHLKMAESLDESIKHELSANQ